MKITSDWHIHSQNSCDGASMPIAALKQGASEKGITDYAVTDHLHTPFNKPDIVKSRAEFLANDPSPRFHFGIELSVVSRWELDELATGKYENPVYGLRTGGPAWGELAIGITADELAGLQVEYVVAGAHWPMYLPAERDAIIRDYHRQNMFLACHPLVDIAAHPWWWMGYWKSDDGTYPDEPWLGDFKRIPASMHEEFAAALVEHDTVAEINISANVCNRQYPERFIEQYLEYIAELKSRGVKLSIGSDCHAPTYNIDFERVERMLDGVGISEDDLWCLPPRK